MRSVVFVILLLLGCTRIDGPQPSPVDPQPDTTARESRLATTAIKAYASELANGYEALAKIQDSDKPLTPKQVHEHLSALGEAARKSGWKGVTDDDAVAFADGYDPKKHAARLRRVATGIRSAVK